VKSRTRTLLILASLVAFAGCPGIGSTGPDVTDEEARERALDAEKRHITEQLEDSSCVESWSLHSFVGLEEQATVTNRTDSGAHVAVKHPYSYSTKRDEADVESEANYLVTADDVNRVSGTNVSPC